jgi:hypothetical protein
VREIAKALRRHVDQQTLEKVINDLLDVPGDKSFRDTRAAGACVGDKRCPLTGTYRAV